jgi:hypothetical protein
VAYHRAQCPEKPCWVLKQQKQQVLVLHLQDLQHHLVKEQVASEVALEDLARQNKEPHCV